MKIDIKFPENDQREKKTERFALAVGPSLKAALDSLPAKYKTENTEAFLKQLVEAYEKSRAS